MGSQDDPPEEMGLRPAWNEVRAQYSAVHYILHNILIPFRLDQTSCGTLNGSRHNKRMDVSAPYDVNMS